jgi:choice-of-anchor A domain-containing protein
MVAAAALLVGMPIRPASADYIGTELGVAGDWAVLGIGTTGSLTMSGGSIVGNVGVAGGSFTLTNGTINGSTDLTAGVNFTRTGGSVTGGINTNFDLSSAVRAANNGSTAFGGLAATMSIPGGRINGATTITLNSGVNVIDLSGITLTGQSLTLNGPSGSEVILNDSGAMTLTSAQIVLTGGLTANDVVFNDTGNSSVTMTGGVLNGTILAPNASVTMTSGLVNGEIIGGSSISLAGGQVVDAPRGAPGPVIGAGLPAFLLFGGGCLLAWRMRRRAEGGPLTASASP